METSHFVKGSSLAFPHGAFNAGESSSLTSKAVALPVFRSVRFIAMAPARLDSSEQTTNGREVNAASVFVSTANTFVTRQSANVASAVTNAAKT